LHEIGTFVWLKWKQLLQNTNVEKVYNFRIKSEAGKFYAITNENGDCEIMQVLLNCFAYYEQSHWPKKVETVFGSFSKNVQILVIDSIQLNFTKYTSYLLWNMIPDTYRIKKKTINIFLCTGLKWNFVLKYLIMVRFLMWFRRL